VGRIEDALLIPLRLGNGKVQALSRRGTMGFNIKSATKNTSEFDNFSRFVRGVLNVPHIEIKRKLDDEQKRRDKEKAG
jgi:hypothetical protein